MNKMLDHIMDGPHHPDEDAEYLADIANPIPRAMECPECKEIALTLKRIEPYESGNLETWGCVSCGCEVNFG